jgi:hypothetical protein
MVAGSFYRTAAEVARQLGRRAVLVGRDPRNALPGPLPDGVAAFEYAAYSGSSARGRDRPSGRRRDDRAGAAGG